MKQQRFDMSKAYKPTPESIKKQIERHKKYNYYGIPIGVFCGGGKEIYDVDDIRAMDLISRGKKLPKDLEQRLLAKKETRPKFNASSVELDMTNEELEAEVERLTGIKVSD